MLKYGWLFKSNLSAGVHVYLFSFDWCRWFANCRSWCLSLSLAKERKELNEYSYYNWGDIISERECAACAWRFEVLIGRASHFPEAIRSIGLLCAQIFDLPFLIAWTFRTWVFSSWGDDAEVEHCLVPHRLLKKAVGGRHRRFRGLHCDDECSSAVTEFRARTSLREEIRATSWELCCWDAEILKGGSSKGKSYKKIRCTLHMITNKKE